MIDKCKKVLNVMRCMRGMEWGTSRPAMRTIYIGLIRSVFDYGSVVYRSAANILLKKLDVVQSQALRLCYGASKTTPINVIQVEMGEMPLHIRRDQLALVYWANLKGHKEDHISQSVLLHCQERDKAHARSFGWIIFQKAREMELHILDVCPTVNFPTVPLWLMGSPVVDLDLLEVKSHGEINIYSRVVHKRK